MCPYTAAWYRWDFPIPMELTASICLLRVFYHRILLFAIPRFYPRSTSAASNDDSRSRGTGAWKDMLDILFPGCYDGHTKVNRVQVPADSVTDLRENRQSGENPERYRHCMRGEAALQTKIRHWNPFREGESCFDDPQVRRPACSHFCRCSASMEDAALLAQEFGCGSKLAAAVFIFLRTQSHIILKRRSEHHEENHRIASDPDPAAVPHRL